MKEKKIKEKNKKFDFKGIFKNFTSTTQTELTEEEVILSDDSLTEEEKKELISVLDNNKSLAHKLFADSLKVAKNLNLYKNTSARDSKIKINENAYKRNDNGKEREED